VCGLAPGMLGHHELKDAGGPRIDLSPGVDAVKLLDRPGHESYAISVTFTKPVARGSWERGALTVSSLADNGRGWKEEDYDSANVTMEDDGRRVIIELGGARPKGNTLRVSVRGTGPYAVYGTTPRVPFAGRVGGPPGSENQGHDVAYTLRVPGNGQNK
jgi:hypothetical protein